MSTLWTKFVVLHLISAIIVSSAPSDLDLTMTCSSGCQIGTDQIIKAQDQSTLTIDVLFSKYATIAFLYANQLIFSAAPNIKTKSVEATAKEHFSIGDFRFLTNDKVVLPFTFKNISLVNDNEKTFTYQVTSGRDKTNGTRTLNVLAPPKVCGSLKLDPKYTFREKRQNSIAFSLCGNPAPDVTAKIGTTRYVTQREELRRYEYKFVTALNSLTRNECGKIIQFEVVGSNILLASALNVQFVPEQVKNITAQLDHSNCLTVMWKQMKVGNCPVTYELRHSPFNRTATYDNMNTATTWTKCNATLQDTINIRAFYKPEFGAFNDEEVKVLPPPVIITMPPTTQAVKTLSPSKDTSQQGEDDSMHWKYILAIVVGVIALILIVAVVVIATKRKRSSKGDNNNGQLEVLKSLEESDYAEVNSLRSQPSTKEPPAADDAHLIYAELGPGGGRTGPKPVPEESNYAKVKTDGVYYPPLQQSSFRGDHPDGPRKSNFFEPPKYSVASRNKKPSDDDDYVEDILV